MDTVSEYIKNLKLLEFDHGVWDVWIIFSIVGVFILTKLIISSWQSPIAITIKKTLTFIFYSLFYGTVVLVILNAALTNNYWKLGLFVFYLSLPTLRQIVSKLYKHYDKFVDRFIDKHSDNNNL
jgi:hypothetical protein